MNYLKLISSVLSCLVFLAAGFNSFAGDINFATYCAVLGFYFKYEADREE